MCTVARPVAEHCSRLNDDRNVPSLHADEQEGRCDGCGTGIALRQAACLGLAHAVTVDALDFVGCCVRLIDRELESVCFSPPPSSSGVRAPVPAGGQEVCLGSRNLLRENRETRWKQTGRPPWYLCRSLSSTRTIIGQEVANRRLRRRPLLFLESPLASHPTGRLMRV
jgi:hypothetical protein